MLISEILEDASCGQGWDEFSQIIYLCGFIQFLIAKYGNEIRNEFRDYLKDIEY